MDTQWLPCELSDAELLTRADLAARKQREREQREAEETKRRKQAKNDLESLSGEVSTLLRSVRERTEYREVQVEERRNDEERCMEMFRLDTGELVGKRAMTLDELQLPMALGAGRGEETPGGAGGKRRKKAAAAGNVESAA